MFFQLSGLSL